MFSKTIFMLENKAVVELENDWVEIANPDELDFVSRFVKVIGFKGETVMN